MLLNLESSFLCKKPKEILQDDQCISTVFDATMIVYNHMNL